jgi:UDP-2,4-diacetamido-2,4,6-trideoxy-beta-L-altropyranose hydrolase
MERSLSIAIRADANPSLGYGHVRRTLTMVEQLQQMADVEVYYLMRSDSDPCFIQNAGCEVVSLKDKGIEEIAKVFRPEDGPLILDTYTLTLTELEFLNWSGYCTTVFDDSRRLLCYPADIVVDYAPGAPNLPYKGLASTRFCLGPDFFPLRREFPDYRPQSPNPSTVRHIVITFGGSDPDDQTARLLEIFEGHTHPWKISAILGPGYRGKILNQKDQPGKIELRRDVTDMAQLCATADLAISGAGGTSLELAFLGVPALLLELSEDQRLIASSLAKANVAVDLGWHASVSNGKIWEKIVTLARNPSHLRSMRRAGRRLVDGCGAERIAIAIMEAWNRHKQDRGMNIG